jgi:site-specific DNA recombinase
MRKSLQEKKLNHAKKCKSYWVNWALIKDTFLNSDTLIITPSRIYDLEVENDDMSFDFMSIFAKLEYKTIKRRMQQGKVAGAKKGMWTNGKPPFPYYYDKNSRMVLVDETKRPIYIAIVDKYLGGINLNEIAIWLTKQEIPTPYNIKPNGKDRGWSNITVQRLLVSETHLGLITYGRTRTTKRGQLESVPDEERIKERGNHEQLKTQEEHEQITDRLFKNRLISPSARKSTLPLSGLLYCDKCGYKMQFKVGSSKGRGQFWSTLCTHGYKDGSRCEQKGKILDDEFFNALFERIIRIDKNVLSEIELFGTRIQETKVVIEIKEQELAKQKTALEKIQESYEEDTITKQKYLERKGVRTNQIQKLEEELKNLHSTLTVEGEVPTTKQIFDRIDTFKEQWVSAQHQKKKIRL